MSERVGRPMVDHDWELHAHRMETENVGLRHQLAEAQAERDEAREEDRIGDEMIAEYAAMAHGWRERAEAAEAELATLRALVEEAIEMQRPTDSLWEDWLARAQDALGGKPTQNAQT